MAYTTATEKIERLLYEPTFYKVIQGGASASKTYSILTILIGYAGSYPDSLITIVGLSYPHLSAGAIRDFTKIMKEAKRWEDERWNKSDKTYSFPNGSVIEFKSLDNMSARGPRRDVLFVNEANGVGWDTFQELATRTKDFVIIDYNPSAKFWAHEELVEKMKDDTSFVVLTYQDNEALSDRERQNIESHKPKDGEEPSNWWIVYGLGQIGSLEGNVYAGWEQVDDKRKIVEKGKLVRYGLDFGFSNDETAMVAIYELEDGRTGLVENIYQRGLLGSQYAGALKANNIDPSVLIVADSARPEIIAEIKKAGYRIIGADKNAGSVLRGIDRVQQRQIVYYGENLKREYLSYAWRKKRSGEIVDEPQDGNDHCLPYSQKVKTLRGDRAIGELVGKKGWVWCEDRKLRYFRNVRKTGRELVLEFELDDGSKFRCSEEHPIYTLNRGIVPACLLNTEDMIQLDMYESSNCKREKTTIQWHKLLERGKEWLLQKRPAQTPHSTQGCVGVPQWEDTERAGDRPYRQGQGQQPGRELEGCELVGKQQKCFCGRIGEEKTTRRKDKTTGESVAQVRGGEKMALREWQTCVSKEKADRKKLCSLWEKILYNQVFRICTLLLFELQNASKKKKIERATRKYAKMRSRREIGIEDVYCMDVYDTSNFALDNGVIVSNCLDALRYAIDDLDKPRFDF